MLDCLLTLSNTKSWQKSHPSPVLRETYPFPPGHEGAIAAPFIAVTNLIDYTKDPDFDGSIFYGMHVRTNGNTDVDNPSAPGGTLGYIDREFTNTQVSSNQALRFPPVPQFVFPPDDFSNGIIAPSWEILPVTGLSFCEEAGVLKLAGVPEENGHVSFHTTAAQRQTVTVEMDFKCPTGLQSGPNHIYRIQFDPFNYIQIQVDNDGYRLIRVIANEIDAVGYPLSLFGDETTSFHRLRLSYKDATGHVEALVDDIPLGGIGDMIFHSSLANFRLSSYSFAVRGQYIEYEWDNFTSSVGTRSLSIVLRDGWNLISLPLAPTTPAITQALSSIAGHYDLAYAYDAANGANPWSKYNASAPPFLNTLRAVSETMGLWIRADAPVSLTITGTLPVSPAIALREGWNLVGYPLQTSRPVTEALASIAGQYDLVYAYDAANAGNPWKKYNADAPAFLNTLKEMGPGWGYWIRARENCTWLVP